MPHPIDAILTLIAIFSLLLALSFLISVAFSLSRENGQKNIKLNKNANKSSQDNVFYLENSNKKDKREKRKQPDVALKSTLIKPKEFSKNEKSISR